MPNAAKWDRTLRAIVSLQRPALALGSTMDPMGLPRAATIAILLAAVALGACAGGAAAAPPSQSLYLLQSKGGELRGSKLVLHGVSPRVTSFTDRPRRSARSISARGFTSKWKSIFGSDPPNAALEVQSAPAGRDVALLELRRPHYDARRHVLTYSVRRLNHSNDPALAEFDRRADGRAVRRFGRSSLFIDDGGETSPSVVEVQVAAGSTVTLHLTNSTVDLEEDGVLIAGINTPSTGEYGQFSSNGQVIVRGPTMTFMASSGGGGMRVQALADLTAPSSGKTIEGTATIPPGCTAAFIPPNGGEPLVLSSGPFSLPFE